MKLHFRIVEKYSFRNKKRKAGTDLLLVQSGRTIEVRQAFRAWLFLVPCHEVYLPHLHAHHVGALTIDGKAIFPNHTPAHVTDSIESQGQKLVLIGDLIHVAAVQFEQPAVTIGFDTDSDARVAPAECKLAFDAAAKGGYLLGAAHVQFPAPGHARAAGKGYQWIPVNYTQMR